MHRLTLGRVLARWVHTRASWRAQTSSAYPRLRYSWTDVEAIAIEPGVLATDTKLADICPMKLQRNSCVKLGAYLLSTVDELKFEIISFKDKLDNKNLKLNISNKSKQYIKFNKHQLKKILPSSKICIDNFCPTKTQCNHLKSFLPVDVKPKNKTFWQIFRIILHSGAYINLRCNFNFVGCIYQILSSWGS